MASPPWPASAPCVFTGGAGNLGSRVAAALSRDFEQLILLDLAPRPSGSLPGNATYESLDIRDFSRLSAFLKAHRPAAIVHLASLLSGSSEETPRAAWHLNTTATLEILELARGMPGTRVLFASSLATYGGAPPRRLDEDEPQWPTTLYGVTKIACERLGAYARVAHDLDFRCIRLPIVLSRSAPTGAVSAMISNAFIESVQTGRFIFRARPETKVAGLYVKHAAQAFAMLLRAPRDRLTRAVYNIAGFTASLAEISAAISCRLPGVVHSFDPDPAVERVLAGWPSEIDDSRARREWGWMPANDLETTTANFLEDIIDETHPAS